MTDLLSIAASGVRGYRAALDAVVENIASASNPGYARREVALAGVVPGTAGPFVRPGVDGLGVDVTALRRAHDAFLSADARAAESADGRLTAQTSWLTETETVLSAGGSDVGQGVTDFYNAAKGVAAEPSSTVTRNQFLAAADTLAARFRDTAHGLAQSAAATTRDAQATVATVNGLTRQVADLNGRLRRTEGGTAASASLMDERDRLLTLVSRQVAVDVREGERGVVTLRLGDANGAVLVTGATATRLSANATSTGTQLTLGKPPADVTAQASGGALGGTLAGARQIADTATALDALAADFATNVNAAHATGVDLAGTAGTPLFATTHIAVAPSPANNGAAAIETDLADGATPSAAGYTLRYDGSVAQWTLARTDGTGTPVVGAGPLAMDGLTVTLSGAPQTGDQFQLSTGTGAAGLSLRIHDPALVAAADPFIAGPALANRGSGQILLTPNTAAAAFAPATTWRVHMVDAANFEVLDPATVPPTVLLAAQPYVPGAVVAGAGFDFTLSGAPVAGDTFDIAPSTNASGNAAALDRLVATRAAGTGGGTVEDRWDRTTSAVAGALSDAKTASTTATATLNQANAARDSASGVTLDREAADLIRFSQAYQASAKVIQAARDLFDTLLHIGN